MSAAPSVRPRPGGRPTLTDERLATDTRPRQGLRRAELARKLDVLRQHCAAEGRDYDAIEKTSIVGYDSAVGPAALLDALRQQHDLGITAAYVMIPGPQPHSDLERLSAEVIPEISSW